MRLLITGDRNWGNPDVYGEHEALQQKRRMQRILAAAQKLHPNAILVHGNARGADQLSGIYAARLWGADRIEAHPAQWSKYGRAAGPIRNQFMLDESQRRAEQDGHQLTHAIAFHPNLENSTGTKDMVSRLEKRGIPVLKVK